MEKKPSSSKNFFDDDQDYDYSSYFGPKPPKDVTTNQSGKNFIPPQTKDFFSPDGPNEEKMLSNRELYYRELQAIQERTLNATSRSLGVLADTEKVGTMAAQVK